MKNRVVEAAFLLSDPMTERCYPDHLSIILNHPKRCLYMMRHLCALGTVSLMFDYANPTPLCYRLNNS